MSVTITRERAATITSDEGVGRGVALITGCSTGIDAGVDSLDCHDGDIAPVEPRGRAIHAVRDESHQ